MLLWTNNDSKQSCVQRSLHTGNKVTLMSNRIMRIISQPIYSAHCRSDANMHLKFTQWMKFGALSVASEKNKGQVFPFLFCFVPFSTSLLKFLLPWFSSGFTLDYWYWYVLSILALSRSNVLNLKSKINAQIKSSLFCSSFIPIGYCSSHSSTVNLILLCMK